MPNETIRRINEEANASYIKSGKDTGGPNDLGRGIASIIGKGKKVLDIGCGTGMSLFPLRDLGNEVMGIEVSPTSAAYCRSKGLNVLDLDIETDSVEPLRAAAPFDVIIMADVLEHLIDPLRVLKDTLLTILKPSGRVIATVPNFVFLRYRLELLMGNISHFNNDDAAGHDVPRPYNLGHKTMFNQSNLHETFRLAGFSKVSVEPEILSESLGGFWSQPLLREIRTAIKKAWPTLLAARFLVIAEKA